MKKFKKILLWLMVFLVMYFINFNNCTEEGCNPIDYARITDVEYRAEVVDEPGGQGKIIVTERLTYDVHAAFKSNTFWELWRDLCEIETDGAKNTYKVLSVKQILEDGTEIEYEESPVLYWEDEDYVNTNHRLGPGKWYHSPGPYNEDTRDYECVFFYIDGVYREEMVFEIQYEMYNAALRYGDCSDLYISMFSEDAVHDLESFRAEILFPDELMPSPGNYTYTTYGTDAHSFPVEESTTANPGYHTFIIDLDEDELSFSPYNEYIEFDLVSYGEDKHIFTEYAGWNYYYDDVALEEILYEQREYAELPEKYKAPKAAVFVIFTVLAGLVAFWVYYKKYKVYSKHTFYKPVMEYEYYRDIPSDLDPKFAKALVFCKHKENKDDSDVYSALMLSLARKGYIDIKEDSNKEAHIIINKCPYKEAQPAIDPTESGQRQFVGGYSVTVDISSDTNLNKPEDTTGGFNFQGRQFVEELTASEKNFFNMLVHHAKDNYISMKEFKQAIVSDYQRTDSFLRVMDSIVVSEGIEKGYFQKSNYKQVRDSFATTAGFLKILGYFFLIVVNAISLSTRMDLVFGGYTIFGLTCIIGAKYLKKVGQKLILLTQFGEDEYAKWRGLYNFLNSSTLMNERTYIELPLWEKYLVYATAFGISDKVTKAINIRCPEHTTSGMLSNNYYRTGRIRISSRGIGHSVRTGSSIARGGGGGYGGGGRGGGGGGGGH